MWEKDYNTKFCPKGEKITEATAENFLNVYLAAGPIKFILWNITDL